MPTLHRGPVAGARARRDALGALTVLRAFAGHASRAPRIQWRSASALLAALGIALVAAPPAHAMCDVIPQPETVFRGATASTSRVYASEGDVVVLTRDASGCEAGDPSFGAAPASDSIVTLVYTPPQGPRTAVVLGSPAYCGAGVWDANGYEAACEAQLGAGGQAICDPTGDVSGGAESLAFSMRTQGRAGPAKIAVSSSAGAPPCQIAAQRCDAQIGLAACIDELYAADGTCATDAVSRHRQFPGVTALPAPNDFSGICDSPDPSVPCSNSGADVRLATDAAGNLVVPIDWVGVLVPGTLPIPRLVRASSSIAAFTGPPPEPAQTPGAPPQVPGLGFLQSFSPKGLRVDPIFNPLFDAASAATQLFGSVDAERGVLRVLRRSPAFRQCAAGARAGLPCIAGFECPGSVCVAARCRGGSSANQQCTGDAMCPGGECGAPLFDFADRYSAGGTGPVLLTSADYDAEAQNPAAIDGLVATPDIFMFVRSELLEAKDLNLDGDDLDATIVTMRDVATGQDVEIGAVPGALGRAGTRSRLAPFSLPAVSVEDDVLAFLEAEPYEGDADGNADGDALDTLLRVFRYDGSTLDHLTPGSARAADALTRIDRKSLTVSDGLVFYREWEQAGTAFLGDGAGLTVPDPTSTSPRAMTPDGRFIAFRSSLALAPDDLNGVADWYVYDRDLDADGVFDEPGQVGSARVSVDSSGLEAACTLQGLPDPCPRDVGVSISSDGRFVAFVTPLDIDGATADRDLFVRDRDVDQDGVYDESGPGESATIHVNTGSGGEDTSLNFAVSVAMSGEGRWVLFDDAQGGTPAEEIWVHDRDVDADLVYDEPGQTAIYPLFQTLFGVGVRTSHWRMSRDGRHLAVWSRDALLPSDVDGAHDVYVLDRDADGDGVYDEASGVALGIASVTSEGAEMIGTIRNFSMDSSGRFLTFEVGLSTGASAIDNRSAVWLRDRDTDEDGVFDEPGAVETRRLPSPQLAGVEYPGYPVPSLDGRFVGYFWRSDGNTDGDHPLVLVDAEAGTVGYGALSMTPAPVGNRGPSITDGARTILRSDDTGAWRLNGLDTADLSNDLNGDGDVLDSVLAVLDARQPAPVPVVLAASDQVAVAGGHAVFLRPESADGPGVPLNGDVDTDDRVVHLWRNRQGGAPVNLGLAAERVAVSEQVVAALVSEAGEGVLLNGDSDLDDLVVHVNDVATATAGSWTNLFMAADEVQARGRWVAFTVPEAAQGTSLNGDGDLGDRVLRVYDTQTDQFLTLEDPLGVPLPGVGPAVDEFVLGDQVVAFRVNEFGQGQNLNGVAPPIPGGVADADLFDGVIHVAHLATGTVYNSGQAAIPCPVEACDPRIPYRLVGTKVTFLMLETQQGGNDLDQSGDGGTGLVLQHFNPDALAAGADPNALLGGALGGICTSTAAACASDADCGGGTCYFPPGGCLLDSGVVCDTDPNAAPALPGCAAPSFCVPTLGLPGQGTCHAFQGPCLDDAQCTAPAFCTDNGTDPEQLFSAVAAQPDGRQRYVSVGRCSDGDGSCANDGHCSPGATCEAVTVTASAADPDADGLADPIDNCPDRANGDQRDTDGDGIGDACDRQTCGNRIQEFGEGCDHGSQNGLDGVCDAGCAYVGPGSACSDGLDNDGDGRVDLAQDPGCTSTGDTSERDPTRACDDGRDNDGDFRVDFASGSTLGDPGCGGVSAPREDPQCSDGIDNDNDGKYDWDGAGFGAKDPQCGSPSANKEKAGSCGLGFELVLPLAALIWLRRRRRRAA